jgi:hypothetical protein
MNTPHHQSGVALAVTLFMLALLTIIGVSAVMLGTTHFRLVSNLQAEKEAETAMQMAVEHLISVPTGAHADAFNPPLDPAAEYIEVNGHSIRVDISQPRCTGYIESRSGPDTYPLLWEFRAVTQDDATGANFTFHWGVTAPMPIAQCCDNESTNTERRCH